MTKKIPMRQCTGCGEHKPKQELIRIVRTPENEILLDYTGKKNGRGAYICNNRECFLQAVKRKRLEAAFGLPLGEELCQTILKELEQGER